MLIIGASIKTLGTQISQLSTVVGNLPPNSQTFAHSLIKQYQQRGVLSPKQVPYVASLIEQAKPKPLIDTTPGDIGNFSSVTALFAGAAKNLKFPKIRLDLKGTPIVVQLAGQKSKHPGTLNVTGPGAFGARTWYGRVTLDGQWFPSLKYQGTEAGNDLVSLLIDLGLDPAGTLEKYGKLAGVCGFCGKGLTDPRSTAAGYGPICADQWGLKAQWLNATKNIAAA